MKYLLKASKGAGTEITGIFLTADSSVKTIEAAEAALKTAGREFTSGGVGFTSHVVVPEPRAFMKKIDELMPASLVLIGDAVFSDEMVKGGASEAALREKLACPVTTIDALIAGAGAEKKNEGVNWGKFILYAIGSIIMYGVFFPRIDILNEKIFMTGTVLGGLALMVAVVIHAWTWGNTTSILPKLFKLEK